MVAHEERNHYSIRRLEAETPVISLSGRQFRPLFSRQSFVPEKVIRFPTERTYI